MYNHGRRNDMARDTSDITELAEAISKFVNSHSAADVYILGVALTNDHRTLVQKKMGIFMGFAQTMRDLQAAGHTDGRNEMTGKLCTELCDTCPNLGDFKALPCI
jgi:hypothetical protein